MNSHERYCSLTNLPQEVLDEILEYLPATELTRLSSVCRDLHNLVESEILWKQRCYNEFNLSLTQTSRLDGWKKLYKALTKPSVYTWGEGSHGRLGRVIGGNIFNIKPKIVEEMNGKGIAQLVCGGWSMTTLTKQGEVWTWGTMNAEASLQRNPNDYDQEEPINTPATFHRMMSTGPNVVHETPILIEGLRGKKVKSIASGRAHGLALTNSGEVYQWRSVSRVMRISLPEESRIVQIAAGWSHSLALSRDGRIFSWESDTPDIISEGECVTNPTNNERYVLIAGGESFTLGLTNLGNVYKSENGGNLSSLSLFNGTSGRKFTHISAAFRHFAAFNEEGEVAIWDDTGNEEVYPELQHRGVNQVAFGDWHSGALTDDGKLYTWGQHSGGALGHSDVFYEVKRPTLVKELENQYVFSISFAGWHSAALVVPLDTKPENNSIWQFITQLFS